MTKPSHDEASKSLHYDSLKQLTKRNHADVGTGIEENPWTGLF